MALMAAYYGRSTCMVSLELHSMKDGACAPHPCRVILESSIRMSSAFTFFCMNPVQLCTCYKPMRILLV